MTQFDKLKKKLFRKGSNFTHQDAVKLLKGLGYKEGQGRGSAVHFTKPGRNGVYYHIPHGGRKNLPKYAIESIKEVIKEEEDV